MAEQSLKDKTVKGTIWSGIDNILQYSVSFLVSIVLARLLSPDEYGLIGIVAIFTAISTTIINGGFASALIRKVDIAEEDYDTVFIVNLLVSIFLYLLLFIFAPIIASFFGRYELVALTRVQSLGLIIGALAIVQRVRLTKRIDFKTQTKVTFIAAVISGVAGVASAFVGLGVWALVIHLLLQQGINTILLWYYNKWVPKLRFSKKSFSSLFGYSWKILLSGILDTFWKHTYQLIIGKVYTPNSLGQYTRAHQFSDMFSSNITNIVQRVSFPVLSSIQEEPQRLKEGYRKIIRVTMIVTFCFMMGLAATSKNLILVLIGEKWLIAASFLPLICFQMMLYPLHAINLNMLQVKGRSDLFLKLEIAKKIIGVIPLLIGVYVDIQWMLVSSVVVGFGSYYLNAFYSGTLLGYSFFAQLKDLFPSFSICAIMGVLVYLTGFLSYSPVAVLIIQVMVGAISMITFCECLKLKDYMELKSVVVSIISRK